MIHGVGSPVKRKGSYYEEYKRSQGISDGKFSKHKLMTDRTAYIAFLEVQLERVSAACLTTQAFSERIQESEMRMTNLDEKCADLARMVKGAKTSCERAERDVTKGHDELDARLHLAERGVSKLETDCKLLSADIPSLQQEVRGICQAEAAGLAKQTAQLEPRLIKMIEERLGGYSDVYQALERRFMTLIDKHTEEMTQRRRDMEERISVMLDIKLKEFSEKLAREQSKIHLSKIKEVAHEAKSAERLAVRRIAALEEQQHEKLHDLRKAVELVLGETREKTQRAQEVVSKMTQDVKGRVEQQRVDTFEELRRLEDRLRREMRESCSLVQAYNQSKSRDAGLARAVDRVDHISRLAEKELRSPLRSPRPRRPVTPPLSGRPLTERTIVSDTGRERPSHHADLLVKERLEVSDSSAMFDEKLRKLERSARRLEGAVDPDQESTLTELETRMDDKYYHLQHTIRDLRDEIQRVGPKKKSKKKAKKSLRLPSTGFRVTTKPKLSDLDRLNNALAAADSISISITSPRARKLKRKRRPRPPPRPSSARNRRPWSVSPVNRPTRARGRARSRSGLTARTLRPSSVPSRRTVNPRTGRSWL